GRWVGLRRRVRQRAEREQLRLETVVVRLVANETDDGRRDAVERRARHKADVNAHGLSGTGGGGRLTMRRITPPPASSARSASAREVLKKCMTMAVFTTPPASPSNWRASSRLISQTSMRILSLRFLSLLFVARRSTMRLP